MTGNSRQRADVLFKKLRMYFKGESLRKFQLEQLGLVVYAGLFLFLKKVCFRDCPYPGDLKFGGY